MQAQKDVQKERILFKLNPSRWTYFKFYFLGFIFIAIWAVIFFSPFLPIPKLPYFHILLGVGILIIILTELAGRITTYIITNSKITVIKGKMNRRITSLEYEMIAHYEIRQTFLQRLFNYGDIIIQSVAGSAEPELILKDIPKFKQVKKAIDSYQLATRGIFKSRSEY